LSFPRSSWTAWLVSEERDW